MPKLKLKYAIYNEDCFATFDRLSDRGVDLVLVDPPYGTTACKWDSIIPLEPMWKAIKRVIHKNSALIFTASQPFTSILGYSGHSWLRYSWVWKKTAATGHLNAKRMPMKNIEDILIFYEKQPVYNPQGTTPCDKLVRRGGNGENYGRSGTTNRQTTTNYPRTLIEFPSVGKTVHPTQKPVALMEYLIKTYTNPGDRVLDFAMGSGTTGVACGNLGRKFVGCDNDTEHGYFEIAEQRIRSAYAR